MRLRAYISIFVMILAILPAASVPARKGRMHLTQPDGTTFTAYIKGDEFSKIKTTEEGYSIMQDDEGWWCYAIYESDGSRENSGWKVGQEVPSEILVRSAHIPYAAISRIATKSQQGKEEIPDGPDDVQPLGEVRHGMVILAEFQDIKFTNTKEDFENMLMQSGYDAYGATGSAKDYFDAQFSGKVDFRFEVSEVVTLPGKREYYGKNNDYGNDLRPEEMVMDACRLAAEAGLDFSRFDDDEDGYVDNIFVFFAGEDEAEGADENSIWSHSWYIYNGAGHYLQINGKVLNRYACSSELTRIYDGRGVLQETRLSGIGTFCHEYCHTFGLPDMYDTDYDKAGGWAAGLWGMTSIMDSGNQNNNGNTPPNFNAIEREILGIADVRPIDHDGAYVLRPVARQGECYRLETDTEGEYYLFECRSDMADVWDAYIGGSGMLVYHVDRSEGMVERWSAANTVNANSAHQCADLVEADGRGDSFTDYTDLIAKKKNISSIFFPYSNTNSLTPESSPGLKFWSGEPGRFSVTGIEKKEDGSITFNVIGGSEETTPPTVRKDIKHEAFADGAIVSFESSRPFDGEAVVRYGRPSLDTASVVVLPYESGKYSVAIDGLESAKTYFVDISFRIEDIEGTSRGITFMTKKQPAVTWPYMFFGMAKRYSDGTFFQDSRIPLKVYNAADAREIRWTFNENEIRTEGDNYFTLPGSGILKAHLVWEDGREEILMKEINILPTTTE